MRISDWSSDVCSSDLIRCLADETLQFVAQKVPIDGKALILVRSAALHFRDTDLQRVKNRQPRQSFDPVGDDIGRRGLHILVGPEISQRLHFPIGTDERSEEHTSELQSLMRISYAVFCLKKKKKSNNETTKTKHKKTNKN